jgi:hypothetical protein
MFRSLRMARADRYPLNNLPRTLAGGSRSGPLPVTALSRVTARDNGPERDPVTSAGK